MRKKRGGLKIKTRSDTSSKKKRTVKRKKALAKKKVIVPKTRNLGTLTESEYFAKVRSALRNAFRWWKPMMAVLEDASRIYQGPNKRQKKEYQCNHCQSWFKRTAVEIDHIEECGSLRNYDDIVPFLERLTKESKSDYQILCKPCHKEKTKKYLESKKT